MIDKNDVGNLIDATKNAINFRRPSAGLVLHSDRGSNYCSIEYRNYLYDNNT